MLRLLAKGDDLVFVATHDVELLALLADRFVSYHFAEQVSDAALAFDYRIRTGPSSTRNAIALLRLLRYPDEVVHDALSVVDLGPRAGFGAEGGGRGMTPSRAGGVLPIR